MDGRKRLKSTTEKKKAASTPADINEFLAGKRHLLENDIQAVRRVLLAVDASIREAIKWNSISFRTDHDFFATVNLRSTESLQLIFYTGVKRKDTAESGVQVTDPHKLIERWPAKDRCVVTLGKDAALRANQAALSEFVNSWLGFVRN